MTAMKKARKTKIKYLTYIHPLAKLFISLTFIFPIFLSSNLIPSISFLALTLLTILIMDTPKIKGFILTFIAMFPVGISIFLLNAINGKFTTGYIVFTILNHPIYMNNIKIGISLGFRSFALGFISISWVLIIDFNRVIQGMMQTFNLNPKIGFSLFTGVNAIPYLKDELIRVKTIKKLRCIKRPMILPIALNILAQAVRFSERASLSMISKNLTDKRTFYRYEKLVKKDYIAIVIFSTVNLLISILLAVNGYFKIVL